MSCQFLERTDLMSKVSKGLKQTSVFIETNKLPLSLALNRLCPRTCPKAPLKRPLILTCRLTTPLLKPVHVLDL